MERLIDWHIRTPKLLGGLKNAGQYAYMAGVSTEAALHQMVARMERTLKSGQYGVVTVLDVEGAFSRATFNSIMNGLIRNGVDNMTTKWVHSMLIGRSVTASIQEVSRDRGVERGCPQGGVLSPLLWNLVVDEILNELKIKLPQVYSQGFADDLSLYATGIDPQTVTGSMQTAVNMVERWCSKVSLSVDKKASAMIVTRLKKYNTAKITLNGISLEYCSVVRYLGVYLDRRLNWGSHCEQRASRGLTALAPPANSNVGTSGYHGV